MDKYLITGGTGNIGKYVIEELLKDNKDVKVAVRNIEQAEKIFKDKEVELVTFDFLDNSTFDYALEGVKAIFLMRPPNLANPEKDMLPFLESIKRKDIKKLYLFLY